MTDRLHVTTSNGKYTVIQEKEGGMRFLRYGEPWSEADGRLAHVGLILALAYEIQDLRDANEQLVKAGLTAAVKLAR